MEQTLAIIKPDGTAAKLIGEVIRRIENEGLAITAMRMELLSERKAEGFYFVHRHKPFFRSLVTFMTSGPVVLMVLEGEGAISRWRKLMGVTDPRNAAPGTIRRDLATDIERNVVHGSDGPDTAVFEINYFFKGDDISCRS